MARDVRPPPTSLWLVPAEPARSRLRARISELALEASAPSFEPHITLTSVEEVDARALGDAVAAVAASWPPLRLVAGPTGHGATRFKTLFVRFDDARLAALAGELSARLGRSFDVHSFDPHLSLLYCADLDQSRREALAARHDLRGEDITFDTVAASRPGEGEEDVARWELPAARRLRGRD